MTCEWRGRSESGKNEEICNSTRTCLCYIVIIALVVSFSALRCRDIPHLLVYRKPYKVLSWWAYQGIFAQQQKSRQTPLELNLNCWSKHPTLLTMQRLLGLCQTINQIFNSISIKLNEKIFTLQVSDDGFLYLLIATLIISSRFKNISREYAGVSFINERK